MQRGQKLGFVENLVGELRHKPAQPVGAVGVAAAGYGQIQQVGHVGREAVFIVGGAAIGDLDGVSQLENRMVHRRFRFLRYGFVGVRIQIRTGAMMLAEHAAEGMRRHYEAANGVGGLAQFLGVMKTALVTVNAKGQDVAHVGVCLHGADQHHVMPSGKGGELMPVPGPGVLGDAKAPQTEAFRFEDQVFGGQAGISAALGGMDVKVKYSRHKPHQSIGRDGPRQLGKVGI